MDFVPVTRNFKIFFFFIINTYYIFMYTIEKLQQHPFTVIIDLISGNLLFFNIINSVDYKLVY